MIENLKNNLFKGENMNDKNERMISVVEKEALTFSLSLVMKMFFNKMTLNDMIMRTDVRSELLKLNLSHHAIANRNAVINQSPNEKPYFFIHQTALLSSFVENMIAREKEKTVSNIFQIEVEIESEKEKFDVYFDASSLWVKVEGDILTKLWNKMLDIKNMSNRAA